MPPRTTDTTAGDKLPAADKTRKLRREMALVLAGLGLPRPAPGPMAPRPGRRARTPPPALSAEEIRLCQVAARFLEGRKDDPEARRDRDALQAAFGLHEALGDLGRGLSSLATTSATAVLYSEQALTELNDRVLSHVDAHAGEGDEQLDVRFAAADLFYETVLRRSRGRKTRRAGQAARFGERLKAEQEKSARLLRSAQLRGARLPGERTTPTKEKRP